MRVRLLLCLPNFMPIKDIQKRREYQLEWLRRRREDWFRENGPCVECGSWNNLELHHRNPDEKVTHKIWNWSEQRRREELEKCDPLCQTCHRAETNEQNRARFLGVPSPLRKMSEQTIASILHLIDLGFSERTIAPAFGIARSTLSHMRLGYSYVC